MASWYATSLLGLRVDLLLWLFLIYSFAGVVVEGVFCLVTTRRWELRLGLLYLPLRPLYGAGGAACTLFLTPLLDHPVAVFASSVVICSVVEFVAGWAVERAFGTVSWDYSGKRLNLRGRICLQYSLAWGVLATAALYGCHGLLVGRLAPPGPRSGAGLLTVALTLTSLSAVLTLAALTRVRRRVDRLRTESAGTPVTVPSSTWERLVDQLVPDRVLINSFPRMGLAGELRELSAGRPTAAAGSSSVRREPATSWVNAAAEGTQPGRRGSVR